MPTEILIGLGGAICIFVFSYLYVNLTEKND